MRILFVATLVLAVCDPVASARTWTDSTGKHTVEAEFVDLKDRKLLPESQDIRQFAQIIGLKEIGGKSREDLVPKLMRFLIGEPTVRLQRDIQRAAGVSEEQRQQGFSVLADKLLAG